MPQPWSARVLGELKKHRPAQVRAKLLDGDKRNVALGKSRNTWAPAMKVLEEIAWESLELLDDKDRLQAIVACVEHTSTLDEHPPRSKIGGELYDLTKVMLEAQRVVLNATFEMLKPTLDVNRAMIHDLQAQLITSRKQASTALDNANELAERIASANAKKAAGDEKGWAAEAQGVLTMVTQAMPLLERIGLFAPAAAPERTKPAAPKGQPPTGAAPPTNGTSQAA